jgi:hypothetical protein
MSSIAHARDPQAPRRMHNYIRRIFFIQILLLYLLYNKLIIIKKRMTSEDFKEVLDLVKSKSVEEGDIEYLVNKIKGFYLVGTCLD